MCKRKPFPHINCKSTRGWSRADLRLVYRFWGHLIWASKFKKARKRKINVLHKNEKLPSVTLCIKLSIKWELIIAVNRTKNYHSTLIFWCFCHFQSWFNTVQLEQVTQQVFLEHLEVQILKILPLAPARVDPQLRITLLMPKLDHPLTVHMSNRIFSD